MGELGHSFLGSGTAELEGMSRVVSPGFPLGPQALDLTGTEGDRELVVPELGPEPGLVLEVQSKV